MTQQRASAVFLNDPDYELHRKLLDRISDLERRLQAVERTEYGKAISTLANDVTTNGELYLYNDTVGLSQRLINRLGNSSITDHFRTGSAPSGYAWQGAPFATPSTVVYNNSGDYFAASDAANTGFFAKTGISTYLNKAIAGRIHTTANSSLGFRIDDGTDNNYYQGYLTYTSAGTGTLKTQQRTGGGAVTTTTAVNVLLNEFYVVRLLCFAGGAGHTDVFYFVNEIGDTITLATGSNVSWVVSRAGIVMNIDSASKGGVGRADWFYSTFS